MGSSIILILIVNTYYDGKIFLVKEKYYNYANMAL